MDIQRILSFPVVPLNTARASALPDRESGMPVRIGIPPPFGGKVFGISFGKPDPMISFHAAHSARISAGLSSQNRDDHIPGHLLYFSDFSAWSDPFHTANRNSRLVGDSQAVKGDSF